MVLTNSKQFDEMLLNINNDIYRLVSGLNKDEEFKRLLICTDFATNSEKDLSIDFLIFLIESIHSYMFLT